MSTRRMTRGRRSRPVDRIARLWQCRTCGGCVEGHASGAQRSRHHCSFHTEQDVINRMITMCSTPFGIIVRSTPGILTCCHFPSYLASFHGYVRSRRLCFHRPRKNRSSEPQSQDKNRNHALKWPPRSTQVFATNRFNSGSALGRLKHAKMLESLKRPKTEAACPASLALSSPCEPYKSLRRTDRRVE